MIRRLLIPLLGAGLLLAATAGSAFAKCEGDTPPEFCKEVMVTLGIGGGEGTLQAGIRETVTVNVSLGEQPYDANSVVLTFARVADGDAVVVPAVESARHGLWTADVLLNDGGTWTVVAQVIATDGAETMVPFDTIQVRQPPALPPATTPITPPPAAPPILPIGLALAGLAAVGLAWQALRARRRAGAGVAAPAGGAAAARGAATVDQA